jgi:nucleoside phosphorylase
MSQEDQLPTVAVVTILGVELDALRRAFGFTESDRRPGGGNLYYEKGHTSLGGPVRLQLHIQGKAGNTDAAAEAMSVLHAARPKFMVLCGIAAGCRGKVKIGDVVVPRAVVDTTRKVAQDGRLLGRPEITSPQAAVVKMTAASVIASEKWRGRFRQLVPDPLVPPTGSDREYAEHVAAEPSEHDAAVLSDNLLLRDPAVAVDAANTLHQQIRAAEMEAAGFVAACGRLYPPVPWYIVRGISDFGDQLKADQFHRLAACAAASYTALYVETVLDLRIWDLPASRPAAPAPEAPVAEYELHGVPHAPDHFVGRADDIKALKGRLGIGGDTPGATRTQVLTAVRGWPGVGKTTVATWLARGADVRHTYPDGVLWVSLGESPNLIGELARCGRYLGTDSILGVPTVAEAADQLTKLLRGKRVLMVVDDVWEPGHAAPFRQAAPAGSAILVTTRQSAIADQLGPGSDGVYNLRVLDERHGLDLLRALAGDVVAAHPDECLELVRVLECLPLALHVAGRLLAAEHRNGWGVGDLLADLRGPASQLLSAPAPLDRADRATSVIPTVEMLLRRSTDRLDQETRERFAWLGAFAPKPATFALDAMQAVWDVPDARPTVRELVARGLLEPAGNRFQMHALLVAHARGLCE